MRLLALAKYADGIVLLTPAAGIGTITLAENQYKSIPMTEGRMPPLTFSVYTCHKLCKLACEHWRLVSPSSALTATTCCRLPWKMLATKTNIWEVGGGQTIDLLSDGGDVWVNLQIKKADGRNGIISEVWTGILKLVWLSKHVTN